MQTSTTLQLAQRGLITLPKSLRDEYGLNPGDSLTLIDIGGVFVLSPYPSQIDQITARISERLSERGETLESMLATLREVREEYGREG
jgi:bifunctional DNA-binding transcriptional regulator/antitoxin component of YhaV-PrlF toxin-antitoxin module